MIIAKILLKDHVYLMKWINSRRFRIFIKADNKEIHSKFKIPNLGIDDFCIDLYWQCHLSIPQAHFMLMNLSVHRNNESCSE